MRSERRGNEKEDTGVCRIRGDRRRRREEEGGGGRWREVEGREDEGRGKKKKKGKTNRSGR